VAMKQQKEVLTKVSRGQTLCAAVRQTSCRLHTCFVQPESQRSLKTSSLAMALEGWGSTDESPKEPDSKCWGTSTLIDLIP
jgi:hypothetical protein